MAQPSKNPYWSAARPFVLGGSAGMLATLVIQPIDMIKVQKQLYEGTRFPPPRFRHIIMMGNFTGSPRANDRIYLGEEPS
jgi:hypothetical protein